jgi:hypothetical protein
MADLEQIMAERDSASGNEPTEQPSGPSRDDSGRFAAQQPQAPAAAQPEGPQPGEAEKTAPGMVPIQALDKERGEVRALKEQLQQFEARFQQLTGFVAGSRQAQAPEAPKPDPDWFDDPNAAFKHRLDSAVEPLRREIQGTRESTSEMIAIEKYGEEAVTAAYQAAMQRVQSNPVANRWLAERIMGARHPYGELVKWHKEQSALSDVGDDPKAFRERLRAEILVEMQGGGQPAPNGQQGQQPAPPAAAMPTNFAGARNAGPRTAVVHQGPRPLSEIMGERQ